MLFKTTNGGDSWKRISGDLTRNDPSKLGSSGGPITQDNTSVEYYCTIFSACESAIEKDVLWAGSDDGLLHVTRDGGKKWVNVTPPELPEWAQINSIEPHPTLPGGLYVAATRYKLDDFKPYLFKTEDYGASWTAINDGIHRQAFTRVIRADPAREGLLYAGTESGLYISLDDGRHWSPFQCNLPIVPITDLAVKNGDLIVATQGRSFWMMDDLSPIHQWTPELLDKEMQLLATRPTIRMRGGGSSSPGRTTGQNALAGVPIRFYAKDVPDEKMKTELQLLDPSGDVIQTFSTKPDADRKQKKLKVVAGVNELRWNMRYQGAETFEGMVLWGGGTGGPIAVPGVYQAKLTVSKSSTDDGALTSKENIIFNQTMDFKIEKDPRSAATQGDFQAQFKFLIGVRDKLSEIHLAIKSTRDIREQLKSLRGRLEKAGGNEELVGKARNLDRKLLEVEQALYQTKNESPQDPLNYPIRLNNRLSGLVGVVSTGDNRPTRQSIAVRNELIKEIDDLLTTQKEVVDQGIKKFNEAVRKASVPAIFTKVP